MPATRSSAKQLNNMCDNGCVCINRNPACCDGLPAIVSVIAGFNKVAVAAAIHAQYTLPKHSIVYSCIVSCIGTLPCNSYRFCAVTQSDTQPRNISPADMHGPPAAGDPLKHVTESFKSRWSAVSSKCKEIFSRQTNAKWAGRDQQASTTDADNSSSAA